MGDTILIAKFIRWLFIAAMYCIGFHAGHFDGEHTKGCFYLLAAGITILEKIAGEIKS